jgi:uncharacterized protein (DUF433 family)
LPPRLPHCYQVLVGKSAIYGGRDARDVPMYGFVEAARLLRVPASTLRSWTIGQDYRVRGVTKRFHPPIPVEQGQHLLTFLNLVEAFVLASMRRDFNVELGVIRTSVEFVRSKMHAKRPLLTEDFYTDGVSLLVEKWGRLVDASKQGQLAMRDVVEGSLERVVRDEKGIVAKLYPYRADVKEARVIELDPRRALGKAVVAGTSVPVDVLSARYRAGDTIERLAKDYAIEKSKVAAVVAWDEKEAA